MKSVSIESRRDEISQALQACRNRTLELATGIEQITLCYQAHPDFSPVGWHLGHIAFTEAYWILERCAQREPCFTQYHKLFAADGLAKAERQNLPTLTEIQAYLATVRSRVLAYLEVAPLERQERLWQWLIQHESQHSETMAFVLQLQQWKSDRLNVRLNLSHLKLLSQPQPSEEMIKMPAGAFILGSDTLEALDNERPAHQVYLNTYWIDRYPVTCRQYREFIEAGGYQNAQWWSAAGWKWLEANPVSQPLYWSDSEDWNDHPVCGVNWYEADAYARFASKRLPTEAEWEKAASWNPALGKQRYPWGNASPNAKLCNHDTLVGHTTPVNAYPAGQSLWGCYDMLGNVWEWTASWFESYEGFVSYPYRGYSAVYFDNQHRVLRGGSWATRSWGLRNSFRNWYHPWVRQTLAGFRCARDDRGN